MNEKLRKMMAKSEKFEIPELDLTLDVQELSVGELAELSSFNEKNDNKEAINFLVYRTLRKSIPSTGDEGVSDDELKRFIKEDMKSSVAEDLIEKVLEISDLDVEGDVPDRFRE